MPVASIPNPNHHLWRNGRLWWIAFTVVYDGWRQERVRRSLGTADLEEARRRRDDLLHQFATQPNADVVAFRVKESHTTQFPAQAETFVHAPAFGVEGAEQSRV
ncbi:MAG: hypothetical protein HYU53_05425 [Acidobacteria bacterium]|nr:hypothetical protein [Acidobacteriota bacterium]